ncbi:MAG: RnfH family protein [Xanthomonadales bacterium]|nr:RnfH family protein [Xanthomonadales bacterium]
MVAERISIEVAAGLPRRQVVIPLEVAPGTTLAGAVALAELSSVLPELEIDENRLGIFGKLRPPDTVLRDGDRAEVYRPLAADPKEIRRQLAELARRTGKKD